MLDIFGKKYFIDFEVLDDFLLIDGSVNQDNIQKTERIIQLFDETGKIVSKEVTIDDNIKHKEINGVRFELIRNFIEDLASGSETNSEDYDETLGSRNLKKMPMRFKLAFNTLLFYNILKKLD